MKASKLHELQSRLQAQGISFAYCGCITESMLTGVASALKHKLQSDDIDTRTIRSVFAVFVEQMQNIIRYSAEHVTEQSDGSASDPERRSSYGILTIGQVGEDIVVHSGNLIDSADVPVMRARLLDLQGKSTEELRAEYKSRLRGSDSELGQGAGVGFIEIARRASKPIEFEFETVDDEHAFFAIKATI